MGTGATHSWAAAEWNMYNVSGPTDARTLPSPEAGPKSVPWTAPCVSPDALRPTRGGRYGVSGGRLEEISTEPFSGLTPPHSPPTSYFLLSLSSSVHVYYLLPSFSFSTTLQSPVRTRDFLSPLALVFLSNPFLREEVSDKTPGHSLLPWFSRIIPSSVVDTF